MNLKYWQEKLHFDLDEELVSKYPAQQRDKSRLMIVDRKQASITIEPQFKNIIEYLLPTDILVINTTKVSKRRLYLLSEKKREHEIIFLECIEPTKQQWNCMIKNSRKLSIGSKLYTFDQTLCFELVSKNEKIAVLKSQVPFTEEYFEKYGNLPIPPYLKRRSEPEDNVRYQTIFAEKIGSVAAPTAALHFSQELLTKIQSKGIEILNLTLNIGYGTFAPVTEKNWTEKKLHKESYTLSKETAQKLNIARKDNRRIISVGTTTLRVLETVYDPIASEYKYGSGDTEIFLTPLDKIQSIDGLITNFHLSDSSLILLVAAFAGVGLLQRAYQIAILERLRFYSYGDSMFILNKPE